LLFLSFQIKSITYVNSFNVGKTTLLQIQLFLVYLE